jgi:hypothetical protein
MALTLRTLAGSIRCDGIDAEDIGSDEPIHESRSVDQVLIENQDTLIPFGGHFRWGGECRVEVDFHARLLPKVPRDQAIEIFGQARFFEGASEDTGELEDSGDFFFIVPRSLNETPPITFQVPMHNTTVVGAEDHATVTFSLKNKQGPEDE